jgi:3-oxoacyl-[acyl-carrier-protein] synthase II
MSTDRRIVITGLGMVTSLGLEVEENWQKALNGVSGIKKLSYPDADKSPVQAVGAVGDNEWDRIQQTFIQEANDEGERRTLFALWSANEAIKDAGISTNTAEHTGCGVVIAAGLGINRPEDIQKWTGNDSTFDYVRFGREKETVHRESLIRNNSNRPSALIAEKFGLSGYNATISTACASSTQTIGTAYRTIKRGDADLIVAGGADSMINPIGLVYFVLLSAAATSSDYQSDLCRPFDRKRSGLVMGEGAGIAVLEEESHARKRGARIYAEVVGYSSTMDAFKVTAPDPKGVGAEHAMSNALHDAGLNIDDIDYINAHGTSTKLNDTSETMAIKKVFKERAAISNSFGFGGQNATIVIKKYQ